jgi:hypothetical protein
MNKERMDWKSAPASINILNASGDFSQPLTPGMAQFKILHRQTPCYQSFINYIAIFNLFNLST